MCIYVYIYITVTTTTTVTEALKSQQKDSPGPSRAQACKAQLSESATSHSSARLSKAQRGSESEVRGFKVTWLAPRLIISRKLLCRLIPVLSCKPPPLERWSHDWWASKTEATAGTPECKCLTGPCEARLVAGCTKKGRGQEQHLRESQALSNRTRRSCLPLPASHNRMLSGGPPGAAPGPSNFDKTAADRRHWQAEPWLPDLVHTDWTP